jgi:hypothetical protein
LAAPPDQAIAPRARDDDSLESLLAVVEPKKFVVHWSARQAAHCHVDADRAPQMRLILGYSCWSGVIAG